MIWFLYGWLLVGVAWFAYLALEWAYRRGFREGHARAISDMLTHPIRQSIAETEARIEDRSRRIERKIADGLRRTKGPVV